MSSHSIDFLKEYNRKPELSSGKKTAIVYAGAAAAMTVAFAAALVASNAKLSRLDNQCEAQQSYIDDPAVQSKYASYEDTLAQYNRELALSAELSDTLAAIESYPTVDSALLRAVNSAAGGSTSVSQFEYSDTTGSLTLSGQSKDYYEGANYASRLEGLDRILDVGYHGYYLTDGSYAFEDDCSIKPGSASVTTQR